MSVNKINYSYKTFEELSSLELYKLLQLRSSVFVVEQACIYQDVDDLDLYAIHILGYLKDELVSYARVFENKIGETSFTSIGRVLVHSKYRKYNFGNNLVEVCINYINNQFNNKKIKISAQCYLLNFYKKHGFKLIGEEYMEDGIPHIAMIYLTD